MSDNVYKYIWRCARCSYHFANIAKMDGMLKQEKKCPKCKSLNILTLANKEIYIQCKLYDPRVDSYRDEFEENSPYPGLAER